MPRRGLSLAWPIIATLVAACGGAATTPGSTPTTAPSASVVPVSSPTEAAIPALAEVFISPTKGYAVNHPAGWVAHPATEPWLPSSGNFWDDPVGDRIESASAGFRGTSQPLAVGQTPDAWLTAYLGSGPSCGESETVAVGDQLGTIDLNGCRGQGRLGGLVFDVAVVADGRGYNFTMEGDVDHALFLAMLATVRFDATAATDPPGG